MSQKARLSLASFLEAYSLLRFEGGNTRSSTQGLSKAACSFVVFVGTRTDRSFEVMQAFLLEMQECAKYSRSQFLTRTLVFINVPGRKFDQVALMFAKHKQDVLKCFYYLLWQLQFLGWIFLASFVCHTLLHMKPICQMSVDLKKISLLLRVALLMLKPCLSFRKHTVIKCQQQFLTQQQLKRFVATRP